MIDSRDDPRVRLAARLLSSLAVTPDAGLERFRERRTADIRLRSEDLQIARDVLDAVGFALSGTDRANWQRLRRAWEIVKRNTPPEMPAAPSRPHPARASETLRSPLHGVGDATQPRVNGQVEKNIAEIASPDRPNVPPITATPSAMSATLRPLVSPATEASVEDLDSTQGIDAVLASQKPLPFSGQRSASPSPAQEDEPHPDVGRTSLAIPTLAAGAFPFGSNRRERSVFRDDSLEALDTTSDIDAIVGDEDALPFTTGVASATLPSAEAVDDTHPDAGATSFMIPALSIEDDLPFEASAKPPVELTLRQYASFVVDCERAAHPQRVWLEYGIADAEAAGRLATHWRRRLEASAVEREELERLAAGYRRWLDREKQ